MFKDLLKVKNIKKFIKRYGIIYLTFRYIQGLVQPTVPSMKFFHRALYQCCLNIISYKIKNLQMVPLEITHAGDVYIEMNDGIKLFYNPHYESNQYTEGDGQGLEFGSANKYGEIEKFLSGYMKNGMSYFDIGANNGYFYSLKLAKKFPDAKIYAFEPDPKISYHFEKNIIKNSIRNIKIENIALAEIDAEDALLTRDLGANGYLLRTKNSKVEAIQVKCKKFDTYINENKIDKVDIIKVDIEGGELNFLRGSRGAIELYRPILILEVNDLFLRRSMGSKGELLQFFQGLDYLFFEFENDVLAIPSHQRLELANLMLAFKNRQINKIE